MDRLELERALRQTTPRVATVVLLSFDDLVECYWRKHGDSLTSEEKRAIRSILRFVLARECRA